MTVTVNRGGIPDASVELIPHEYYGLSTIIVDWYGKVGESFT